MTAKYFAILTNQGAARLANAAALGTKLNLTQMAVGDANGTLPTPDPAQTKLINQRRIRPLNLLTVDPDNNSQIIAEQIIPENEGGFWIREIGLYDDEGILIAVANCPETYKPQLQEGSGRTQTIRMILIVSGTSAITLKIDPSVVLATRKYVDDKAIEVSSYANEIMRLHKQDSNPHSQYAPIQSPEFTGKPTAPTPAKNSNDRQLATTQFVSTAISELVSNAPAALDTLAKLAAAIGNDANFSNSLSEIIKNKQNYDKTLSDLAGKTPAQILLYLGLPSLITGNVTESLNTLEKVANAIDNDANFANSIKTILGNKQNKDDTLTNLSGKTAAQVAVYIGALRQSQNLADLPNPETARTNLEVPRGVDAQMPFAWCKFNGASGLIYRAHNISSVRKDATGRFAFNFTRASVTSDYAVIGSAVLPGAPVDQIVRVFGATDRLTTGFNVVAMDNNTDTYADAVIDVCVLGG
ncbi:phage tail protein [Enterobacter sp. SA187]|uniref:phage tail protein n=1 Tax=Enterobacter sp. SA187 TaxID=1914861 RepID=UPI0009F81CCD|nr:phage tail protein [Enterobacter sp. SA187]